VWGLARDLSRQTFIVFDNGRLRNIRDSACHDGTRADSACFEPTKTPGKLAILGGNHGLNDTLPQSATGFYQTSFATATHVDLVG
jgi:hypothetical protein